MMNLDNYHLLTIFVVGLVVILGASEIGRLLGLRATGRGGDDVSTLEGAVLGLLALMIGFTFERARKQAIPGPQFARVTRLEPRACHGVSERNEINAASAMTIDAAAAAITQKCCTATPRSR